MKRPYSSSFFDNQKEGSVESATIVVPLVLSLLPVDSVIDVGCGVGGWLAEFRRNGVSRCLGLDGDYVDRSELKIPEALFRAVDLRAPDIDPGRFDLACCLEVAEHLPAASAPSLVALLAAAAPVVLFSAAIPDQGGTDHVNEQWQSYWSGLFAQYGYTAYDAIRPAVFFDERVKWWYSQNMLVFAAEGHGLSGYRPVSDRFELDRIHPALLSQKMELMSRPMGKRLLDKVQGATSRLLD